MNVPVRTINILSELYGLLKAYFFVNFGPVCMYKLEKYCFALVLSHIGVNH